MFASAILHRAGVVFCVTRWHPFEQLSSLRAVVSNSEAFTAVNDMTLQPSQGLERGCVIYLRPFMLESEGDPHGQKTSITGNDEDMFENQS